MNARERNERVSCDYSGPQGDVPESFVFHQPRAESQIYRHH